VSEARAPALPQSSFGRYELLGEIATGGMATVHVARLTGPMGFSRIVAIKRLRPAYAQDPTFVDMLVDEARLGARIQHPNVVATLDIVLRESETLLVLDYVHGQSLSRLLETARERQLPVPVPVAIGILGGTLRGLHAAHTARDESGAALEIVHRDLSPHNILVGVDGIARVADFGVAKARGRLSRTETGVLKGKAGYMAPEQVHGEASALSDVFAIAVVAWEILAGRRLFTGGTMNEVLARVIAGRIDRLRDVRPDVSEAVAAVVHQGLERDVKQRPPSALDMAQKLEATCPPASATEIGAWVQSLAGEALDTRNRLVAQETPTTSEHIAPTALLTHTLKLESAQAPGKRRRWVFAGAGLVALLLLAGGVVLVWMRQKPGVVQRDDERIDRRRHVERGAVRPPSAAEEWAQTLHPTLRDRRQRTHSIQA